MRPVVVLRAAVLGLACCAGSLRASQQDASAPKSAPAAATALDVELPWSDFDALVLARHGMTEIGRSALRHLLRARLLDRLALESKLAVPDAEIDKKWKELEQSVIAAGEATNLDEYLKKQRVTRAKLREFLRLAIVQESLARQALGIPSGRAINGEQQEMWLDQIVDQRGTQFPPPPWADGVVARCGDLEVKLPDFLSHLKEQIAADDLREDCYQALLAKRAAARMPDLSGEALERAIDAELDRRRLAAESDPQYKGLSFQQIMGAQGLTISYLRRDPALVVSALAHVWVDRTEGEDGLRKVYADRRAEFDRVYGEAYETRAIFLRGAKFTNDLNPRSFDDAEREIAKFRAQIKSLSDFERIARSRSEDPATREKGGLLGFVSRGDEQVPDAMLAAIFAPTRKEDERMVGPVRLQNPSGVALLWIGDRRPAPGWDEMRTHVHNELRRRFIDDCLQKKDVVTYLDRE